MEENSWRREPGSLRSNFSPIRQRPSLQKRSRFALNLLSGPTVKPQALFSVKAVKNCQVRRLIDPRNELSTMTTRQKRENMKPVRNCLLIGCLILALAGLQIAHAQDPPLKIGRAHV